MDSRIGEVLGRQGGVAAGWQLRDVGLSIDALKARVRRGVLVRIDRGVYAAGHDRVSEEGRLMAAVLGTGQGAVLSHRSAAALWRFFRWGTGLIDVTVQGAGRRSRRGVRVHRTTRLWPEDLTAKGPIAITSPARTALDLAELITGRRLERALNAADRLRLFTEAELHDAIERHPGRAGGARIRQILATHVLGATFTRSDLEELFHAMCEANGLPYPATNCHLLGRERDFVWHEQRLVVETDGWEIHGTRAAFEDDRARDAELTAAGWRVMRFTWRQCEGTPRRVARQVVRALTIPA